MALAALVLAALALVLALAARSRAASAVQRIDDSASDARRRIQNLEEELRAEIDRTRRLLAEVAAGRAPSEEMILEGRLWRDVAPAEAAELLERGPLRVVDVRTPQETAGGVLPGAVLLPIDELEARLAELPRDGRPTLVYCAGGGRSAAACEFLSAKGYPSLHNLEGGIATWTGPVERRA